MNNAKPSLRQTFPIRKRKIFKRSFLNVLKALLASSVLVALIIGIIWASVNGDEDKFIAQLEALHNPLLGIGLLLLIWVIWFPIYQYLYYASYFYDVDEYNLFIRKGVTSKREVTIPISKITDVYLDQDIFDMLLGLYDLFISTPTSESLRFAHISGLNKEGATQIKSIILDNIHKIAKAENKKVDSPELSTENVKK